MIKCWHCRGKHETVAEVKACAITKGGDTPTGATDTYTNLSERQQVLLSDLLHQLHVELLDGATPETVSYQVGRSVIDVLVDARRSKAMGRNYRLPAGVVQLANPTRGQPKTRTPTQRKPMPDVPEGYYAIPALRGKNNIKLGDGVNDLFFFRVKRPTEGNWSGRIFVDQVIGGRPDHGLLDSLTSQGIGARQVLQAILDFGMDDAGVLFATTLKHCRKCNIHLTRKASRVLMYGPECAEQEGLGAEWRELDNAYGHANAEDDE
jgi:hypothetical protein